MNKLKKLVLFFLIILPIFFGFQQQNDFYKNPIFTVLNAKDGLSNSSVSSIVQDSKGFLWFGTQGGLNRYDGYEFLTYQKEPYKENSLSHELIQTLFMDNNDILWIGTYNGLNRFDLNTGKITSYTHNPDDSKSLSNDIVVAIQRDNEGKLWVGTLSGLQILDEEKGEFLHFKFNDPNQGPVQDTTIRDLMMDTKGKLWIGTYNGVYVYSDGFFTLYSSKSKKYKLGSDYVMSITEDPDGKIWMGCWDYGLSVINPEEGRIENIPMKENRIYSLCFASPTLLLAGSWGGGLFGYDLKNKSLNKIENKKAGEILSNNTVYSIFKDRSGVIWIGTNGGGINKWIPNKPDLVYFKHDVSNPDSLAPGKIKSLYYDPDGYLWVGTYNSGLDRIDLKNSKIKHFVFHPSDPNSLSNDIIRCIFKDSKNNLWICTNDGLNLYNSEEQNFRRFYKDDSQFPLPDNIITWITEDDKGNLWIGTYSEGIFIIPVDWDKGKIQKIDKQSERPISDNLVYTIYQDYYHNMWIGTNFGLNRFNDKTHEITQFYYEKTNTESVSGNSISSFCEDLDHNLWIGTNDGGINLYDREKSTFLSFSRDYGLPDNSINAIITDRENYLWISTLKGLIKFNPQTYEFNVFNEDDGLINREFSTGAAILPKGTILFGGIDIINKIDPVKMLQTLYEPDIQLVSLKIAGKEVREDRLYYNISLVELPYGLNSIAAEFASLDFFSNRNIQYSFRIEGLNKGWEYSYTKRYIHLMNLKPGHYKLQVKGTNSDGIWSPKIFTLDIRVQTPFFLTIWAYIIYVFIFSLFSYGIFIIFKQKGMEKVLIENQKLEEKRRKFLENEIERNKTIEENLRISKESAEKLNKAKDEFIANITHEFRTPLTLIMGYSQMLSKYEKDPSKQGLLTNIYTSGNHLLSLINNILDLSRMELGKIELENEKFDYHEFSDNIISIFKLQAEQKNLNFVYHRSELVPRWVWLDQTRLRQVFFNLLGNALKFTDKGFISIELDCLVRQGNDSVDLIIIIEDSGIGILKEDQERLFEHFTQLHGIEKKYGGSGLGLAITKKIITIMGGKISLKSSPGVGSKFTVVLNDVKTIINGAD